MPRPPGVGSRLVGLLALAALIALALMLFAGCCTAFYPGEPVWPGCEAPE